MNLNKILPPVLRFSSQVYPELATGFLVKVFCYPGPKRKGHKERFPRGYNFKAIEFEGREIATWSWESLTTQNQKGRIILAHGWGGFSFQMIRLVEPLLAEGYSVTIYDQPAHGYSQGMTTTLPEWGRLIRKLKESFPATRAFVCHSFAGLAAGYEVSLGLELEALVVIGSPTSPNRMVDRYVKHFNLNPRVKSLMKKYINHQEHVEFDEYELTHFGAEVRIPVMVIHDKQDTFVNVQEANEWSHVLKETQMLLTDGLGHHQILKEQKVHDSLLQFLNFHLRMSS